MSRDRRTEHSRSTRTRPKPAATKNAEAARARTPAASPTRVPDVAWLLAVPLALGALWYACRGGSLGAAVADDYSFLHRLLFEKPLDPFDSMGATFYWRPVSRQLYFSLVGPW